MGYADLTGNVWLTADVPAIFISDRGADSDPWREEERPLCSLKGPAAGRVVRALDRLSFTVRDGSQRRFHGLAENLVVS